MGKTCLRSQLQSAAHPTRMRVSVLVLAIVFGLGLRPAFAQSSPAKGARDNTSSEYVGSQACGECHKEIFRTFSRTGMGRSMSPLSPEWLRANPTTGLVEDKANNLQLEVRAKDGKLYQSESQAGPDGHEVFRLWLG